MTSASKSKNLKPFVSTWNGQTDISSNEFLACFRKYDRDNNGYIEGSEIDFFLADLISQQKMNVNEMKAVREFKEQLLTNYDQNRDKRIELAELSRILPTEENFLLQFRLQCSDLTSVEFMKIWKHYDSDCSGYLEMKEIQAFCYDLLTKKKSRRLSSKAITEFTQGVIELYDKNRDGRLSIRELQKLLPVEKNYLSTIYQKQGSFEEDDFNNIFDHYDQNNDGNISEIELEALMRDLVIQAGKNDFQPNIVKLQKEVMKHVDKNKDGKIQRKELAILFTNSKSEKTPCTRKTAGKQHFMSDLLGSNETNDNKLNSSKWPVAYSPPKSGKTAQQQILYDVDVCVAEGKKDWNKLTI
eukprot:gene19145-21064_t